MSDDEILKSKLRSGQPVVIDGVLYNMTAEVVAWTNDRLGGGLVQQLAVGIGVLRSGITDVPSAAEVPDSLIAGAYFFNHESDDGVSDITVAVAADDIASGRPEVIRAILSFPFGQLGCRRLSAEIDLSNGRAVRQAEALGFVLEGRKRRKGKGGGDVGVFGLLPEECVFWKRDST